MTVEKGPKPFVNIDWYPGDSGYHDDLREFEEDEEEGGYEFDWNISGEAYAWGKTAYKVSKPHFLHSYINTKGPFRMADLCSAFPVTSQIFREHHRELQFDHAKIIVTDLINSLQDLPAFGQLDDDRKKRLTKELTRKGSRTRRFLTIATLDLLTIPPIPLDKPEVQNPEFKQALTMNFFLRFMTHFNVGEKIADLKKYEQAPKSLFEGWSRLTLESLLEDRADVRSWDLMLQFAQYLISRTIREYRKFEVVSLDNKAPHKLKKAAEKGFPELFRTQSVYHRAHDYMGSYHFVADVFNLPFPPESLSLITSFEGYPFYFPGLPLESQPPKPNHLSFAQSVIDVLKPEGRAVFFPWHVKKQTLQDVQNLREVEEYWQKKGMQVIKDRHHRVMLRVKMGDREHDLASHSPLFTENPLRMNFTALVLVKPKDFVSQEEGGSRGKGDTLC